MNIFARMLVISLAASFCVSSVRASDTTVTVNGKIIAGSCTVNSTLVAGQIVDLGSLGSSAFQRAGEADPTWHNFSLELTDCPVWMTSSTVTLSGTPDASNATLFANTEPQNDAAKNIAVEVSRQSDNTTILANGSTMTVNINTATGTASFPLAARMKTPTGNAGAGKLSSNVLVDFTYQ